MTVDPQSALIAVVEDEEHLAQGLIFNLEAEGYRTHHESDGDAALAYLLATPMQGDYLMWALAPEVPVTYSHMHLFHPDYWDELATVGQGRPGWMDVLEKYRVNLIVIEAQYGPRLRQQLQKTKGWTILLDETDDPKKPVALTRQLIAIRNEPL